ncbi:hypothetical protein P7K49_034242 [Saguinus oedipus]|uniref:Protein phosphatase 1 regulatory subunit 14 n=1 Tax=Saguinus oedipus TaxID=9490 RepID=A0ABQ9TV11_SAGOE|nr:hypothetical protein P7K49_034242 [Saguinus oedipus]
MAAQRLGKRVLSKLQSPSRARGPGGSPGGLQKRHARVTVKYDRRELQRRLDVEKWIDGRLEELYRGMVSPGRGGLGQIEPGGESPRRWGLGARSLVHRKPGLHKGTSAPAPGTHWSGRPCPTALSLLGDRGDTATQRPRQRKQQQTQPCTVKEAIATHSAEATAMHKVTRTQVRGAGGGGSPTDQHMLQPQPPTDTAAWPQL